MNSTAKLSISDIHILDICCKIEEVCAEVYRYFSQLYADNTQAAALWDKTAKEEDNHAEQFRLACHLLGTGIQSLKTDMDKVSNLLAKIQSIYEVIQTSPPTLDEAFRFAIKMEHALAKYHMNAIATFDDESLSRLFSAMMECDKYHLIMLEKVHNDLCN
jgi:rubrerythrin